MATILVADGDTVTRAFLRLVLAGAGHPVLAASKDAEAVRAYHPAAVDLLVRDLYRPAKDGLQAIREVRRRFAKAKVIALSGGAFDSHLDMLPVALRSGATAVLDKPFDLDALLRLAQDTFPATA